MPNLTRRTESPGPALHAGPPKALAPAELRAAAFPDDPTEVVDADGNGVGDRAQYARCGDGAIDREVGEQCDDANRIDADGCDADCRLPCAADLGATRAVFDARTERCFFALASRASFNDAVERCEALEAHLAIPDDAVENDAIFMISRAQPEPVWLGLHDQRIEGQIHTLAGHLPDFAAWGPAEPTSGQLHTGLYGPHVTQDCVAMQRSAPMWSDEDCANGFAIVCESAATPCGDGVAARSLGEVCDDGNDAGDDGCEPDCTLSCPVVDLADYEVDEEGEPVTRSAAGLAGPLGDVVGARYDATSGHCLVAVAATTWADGQRRCTELAGHLWVPDDADENALGSPLVQRSAWLGLHDAAGDGDWRTVQGVPAAFTAWAPGDQEAHDAFCAYRDPAGRWRDAPCDGLREVVCEVAPEPCGDGVVQPLAGETCDAGDPASGRVCAPGCQSDCPVPPDAWAGVRHGAGGPCFVALEGELDAVTAGTRCEALGGHLAIPDDGDEAARLAELGGSWIGVRVDLDRHQIISTDGWRGLRFVGAELWAFLTWRPYSTHLAILPRLTWWAEEPGQTLSAVCEIPPATCGDEVVQGARGEACDGPDLGCSADCGPACPVPGAVFAVRSPRTGRCLAALDVLVGVAELSAACAAVGAVPWAPWSVDEGYLVWDLDWPAWTAVGDAAIEGTYVDLDGTPLGTGFWAAAEPTDAGLSGADCTEVLPQLGWSDVACDSGPRRPLCAWTAPACGDGRLDPGEPCDDGNLVRGDGCDCPLPCAAEDGARAAHLEPSGDCLWATEAVAADAGAAAAMCEAAGGRLYDLPDRWRIELAVSLGGGHTAGGCVSASGASELCAGAQPALCRRAAEPCGDGFLQPALGEACDDGNRADGDGCDSDCTLPCGAEVGATAAMTVPSGACLFRLPGESTQPDAAALCTARGAALPLPRDTAETRAVARLGGAWIGLTDALHEGTFLSPEGTASAFAAWVRGEPDDGAGAGEDCVTIARARDGAWADVPCDGKRPVVCEVR